MIELYVIVAITGATLLGTSPPLQKKGLGDIPDIEIDWNTIKQTIKKLLNFHFILAIILGAVGGLLNMVALSMGQISIVQPLMSFGNFVTVSMGVIWLKEDLSKVEYFEIFLIIVGIILLNTAA